MESILIEAPQALPLRLGKAQGKAQESPAESELVEQARRGDADAFDALMRMHWDQVRWYCRRYLNNAEDIEDMVQTTFLKAHRSMPRYEHRQPFSAWLKRIAGNACIDLLRARSRMPDQVVVDFQDVDENSIEDPHSTFRCKTEHPEQSLLRGELGAAIEAAVQALPGKLREAITLREYLGLPYSEIAEELGISMGVVKSRIYYARQALMKELACFND